MVAAKSDGILRFFVVYIGVILRIFFLIFFFQISWRDLPFLLHQIFNYV